MAEENNESSVLFAEALAGTVDYNHEKARESLEKLVDWSFVIATGTLVWIAGNIDKLPYAPCSQCGLSWYRYLLLLAIICFALSTIGLGIIRAKIYYDQYILDNTYRNELTAARNSAMGMNETIALSKLTELFDRYANDRYTKYISYKNWLWAFLILYSAGIFLVGMNIFFYILNIQDPNSLIHI
jgi:hypothetical protein